jgi:hypothetical protein
MHKSTYSDKSNLITQCSRKNLFMFLLGHIYNRVPNNLKDVAMIRVPYKPSINDL